MTSDAAHLLANDRRWASSFEAGAIAIVLAGLVAFWPVLVGSFCLWDDPSTIVDNPSLRPPTWANVARAWTTAEMNIYIPLTGTAWAGLAWVGGATAERAPATWPFKVASVVVHLVTSVVVFAILRRAVGRGWPAVAGAVLFCVHPLQVETVAWASGMKDLLSGLFAATCLLLYCGRPTGPRVTASLAFLALAMLSKPIAMVVPAMLLAIDLLWLGRPAREAIGRLLPFAVLSAACAVASRSAQPPTLFEAEVSLVARPFVAGYAYAFYLVKATVPAGLAFDYGLTSASIAMRPIVWTAWLLPASLVAIAWLARRRRPLLLAGLVLAGLPIAPVSGIVPFDFARISTVADHYVYLAMIGAAIAIAATLSSFPRLRVVAAIVCVAWAALSMRQSMTWRDAESVARRTLAVNPRSFTSLNHLGVIAGRAGDLDAAAMLQRASLAIEPRNPPALLSLGEIALQQDDAARAIDCFTCAVRLMPANKMPLYALGRAYLRAGDVTRASLAFERGMLFDESPSATREFVKSLRAASTRPTAEKVP